LEGGNWARNFDALAQPGPGRKTFRIVARGNQFWVSIDGQVLAYQGSGKFPQSKVALRLNPETTIYNIRVLANQ
jgi:hypothetical protein